MYTKGSAGLSRGLPTHCWSRFHYRNMRACASLCQQQPGRHVEDEAGEPEALEGPEQQWDRRQRHRPAVVKQGDDNHPRKGAAPGPEDQVGWPLNVEEVLGLAAGSMIADHGRVVTNAGGEKRSTETACGAGMLTSYPMVITTVLRVTGVPHVAVVDGQGQEHAEAQLEHH